MDATFMQHWHTICNKCSLDLMLLTVDHLTTRIKESKGEIETLRAKFVSEKGEDYVYKMLSQHTEQLQRLWENAAKFERDVNDNLLDRVYSWREERGGRREDCTGWREDQIGQQEPRGRYGEAHGRREEYGMEEGYDWQRSRGRARTGLPVKQWRSRQKQNSQHREWRDMPSSSNEASSTSSAHHYLEGDSEEIGQTTQRQFRNPRAPIPREDYPQKTRPNRR
ncbi:hypothetical protein XELAEV_18045258mg [Xenopus laevis]|uniref:Uncharacterized protein n=1 Tax=Xenopus laevis TaxID=8355 RepID=A0A974H417_XENLA|nr:hypothetical protein XELAEV_18045258mg [Xenopus laevis]